MSNDTPDRFSDEQAKAILARAIELESRAPTTTAEQLRAIASDVGISPAALEAAMREQTTALETPRTMAGTRAPTVVAGLGLPIGVVAGSLLSTGSLNGFFLALGVMSLGFVASGSLVVLHEATGKLRSFHLRNFVVWSGIAVGSFATVALLGDPQHTMIGIGWCFRSWIASSILGTAGLIAVKRARPSIDPGVDSDTTEDTASSRRGAWARVAKRVLDWFGKPLRRGANRPLLPKREFNCA